MLQEESILKLAANKLTTLGPFTKTSAGTECRRVYKKGGLADSRSEQDAEL